MGIFVLGGVENYLVKVVGCIVELFVKIVGVEGIIGIGYICWVIYGKLMEDNVYLYCFEIECFVLVYNGVIENYFEIKEEYFVGYYFKG